MFWSSFNEKQVKKDLERIFALAEEQQAYLQKRLGDTTYIDSSAETQSEIIQELTNITRRHSMLNTMLMKPLFWLVNNFSLVAFIAALCAIAVVVLYKDMLSGALAVGTWCYFAFTVKREASRIESNIKKGLIFRVVLHDEKVTGSSIPEYRKYINGYFSSVDPSMKELEELVKTTYEQKKGEVDVISLAASLKDLLKKSRWHRFIWLDYVAAAALTVFVAVDYQNNFWMIPVILLIITTPGESNRSADTIARTEAVSIASSVKDDLRTRDAN